MCCKCSKIIRIFAKILRMFKFIQSKLFLQIVVLLALVSLVVYQVVTSTRLLSPADSHFLWNSLLPLQNHYVAMGLIVGLGLLVQLSLTDLYFFRGGLGETHHLMVFVFFLLMAVCGSFVADFSSVWMSNLVLAVLMTINFDYDSGNVKNKDLFSGILIGIGSLYYLPMIFLSFFVVSSLIVNKYSKYKDIIAFVIGLVIVYLYAICYFFLTDQWSVLRELVVGKGFYDTFATTAVFTWREIVLLAATAVSLLYTVFVVKQHYDTKPILLRKKLVTIHLMMLTMLLMMIFSPMDVHHSVGFLLIPATLYFTMLSQLKYHRLINDLMILVFFVALCL